MSDQPVDVSRYRFPQTVDETLDVSFGGPITQKFLEGVEINNHIINEVSIDPALRNVRGRISQSGKNPQRKADHKKILSRDIVFWSDIYKTNFGSAANVGETDGKPSWKGFRYDFPSNESGDYFHDQFLPTVVCQINDTPGVTLPRLSLVLTRIATNFVKFDIYQLESGNFISGSTDLWVSIFAMGKKGGYHPELNETLTTHGVTVDVTDVVPEEPDPPFYAAGTVWSKVGALLEGPAPVATKDVAQGIFTRAALPQANQPERLGVYQLFWDQLEPTQGNYDGTSINTALSQVTSRGLDGVRFRVYLGKNAPTWAKNLGNGPINYYEPQGGTTVTVPDLWNASYQQAVKDLFAWFAANYDDDARIVLVFASGGMTYYAEPFIRGTNNATNRTNFLNAGYTRAKDEALMKAQLDWMRPFVKTPIGLAYNPHQFINSNGLAGSSVSYMAEVMDYHISLFGERTVLQNNSIRSSYIADPPAMYAEFKNRPSVHHQFQCAAAVRVGDEEATINWAIDYLDATGIEHSNTLSDAKYYAFDAALLNNTPGAGSWTPPTADVVVPAGADLQAAMSGAAEGATIQLSASGTYYGKNFTPRKNQTILGPATIRPSGAVTSNDDGFRLKSNNPVTGVTLVDLDIGYYGRHGVGVWRDTTITGGRIHHNGKDGIGGDLEGGGPNYIDDVEIDNNGTDPGWLGNSGGIKWFHAHDMTIVNSWVHDNTGNGVWCDAQCGDFTVQYNTIENNTRKGVFYEKGGESDASFLNRTATYVGFMTVTNNTIQNNNIEGVDNAHPGVAMYASKNCLVDSNIFGGNGNAVIARNDPDRVADDKHGWILSNITISNNTLNGDGVVGCGETGVTCSNNT